VRIELWFAFVDLSVFTPFGDENGDDESVRVLTADRGTSGRWSTGNADVLISARADELTPASPWRVALVCRRPAIGEASNQMGRCSP